MSAVPSRRGFLRGFTAFTAGSAALAAPIVLAAPVSPDADLLRIDVELATALVAYDAASAAVEKCRVAYESAKPEIPEAIQFYRLNGACAGEWPPGFNGGPCSRSVQNRIRIPSTHDLDRLVKSVDGRTIRGRELRRLKVGSDRFHAAHEAVLKQVGAGKAQTDAFYKGRALIDLGFRAMAIDAVTMQGLAVKGRAGLAMHRAWADDGGMRIESSYQSLLVNLAALDTREGGR